MICLLPQDARRHLYARAFVPRITFALLLLAMGAIPASAITNSHVELFNSTALKDAANTTADWNTAAGRLKLFPLPTLLGSYDTPGSAQGVAISGTLAYVGDFTMLLLRRLDNR